MCIKVKTSNLYNFNRDYIQIYLNLTDNDNDYCSHTYTNGYHNNATTHSESIVCATQLLLHLPCCSLCEPAWRQSCTSYIV